MIAVVVAGVGLLALTRPGRRFFHDKIWAFLRCAGVTIAEVAKSPRHVSLTMGGAVGWPLVEVAAFALCVHAVGGTFPFVEVGAGLPGGQPARQRGTHAGRPGCPGGRIDRRAVRPRDARW
jgi:hypothetical protein